MVEGSAFENRRTERYQGFESLLLRYIKRGDSRQVAIAGEELLSP